MAKFESYLPTILNSEIATDDIFLMSDKSNTYKTRAITFEELDKRYAETAGGSIISGNLAADTFSGNGAALTGITGATGGIANAGNTTIGADTDVDGNGEISLQTRLTTRVTIANDGKVGFGTDEPDGAVEITGDNFALIGSNVNTDSTNKFFRIGAKHYDISEEPTAMMVGAATNSVFQLNIGGGTSLANAATDIFFHTAPDTTTLTGVRRMSIDKGGAVDVTGELYENDTRVISKVEFETSPDLVFNFTSVTEAQATFSRMSLLDSDYIPKYLNNKTITWDMTTDRIEGTGTTNELASTTYQCWLDSDEVTKLAPDLTGTADGNTTNKLIDSAADWVTYLVQVGDELYNMTDLTMGYVGAVDNLNTISCVDADGNNLDLFPDGNEDYKIRMLSPPGLGANRERIGNVYNNSGSDLDDSYYTQIQEEKFYSVANGDFAISGWTTDYGYQSIRQVNDWTGAGIWRSVFNIGGAAITPTTQWLPTITATCFLKIFAVSSSQNSATTTASNIARVDITPTGQLTLTYSANVYNAQASGDAILSKKPTFHN